MFFPFLSPKCRVGGQIRCGLELLRRTPAPRALFHPRRGRAVLLRAKWEDGRSRASDGRHCTALRLDRRVYRGHDRPLAGGRKWRFEKW